ncbi:MAG: C25 family cysteine peptidase, partial [Candidatus Thermoplasmatota archaeon]|nr:C25 family cysteine peptidase [Candidatus Thermoplasmatota archaeon]
MDIIPAWDYDSGDIPASDHGYSNLKGGDEPEVIVGRFIGDSVEEILPQLDTSIGVATGELLNDPTGSALLTSGGWNGMMEYYPNTEDLRNHIEPLMDDVTTVHISDVIDLNKMEVDFSVQNGKMAAGDIDNDGMGEVVVLDSGNDTLYIVHPDTETIESHDADFSSLSWVLVAQMDDDAALEIVILEPGSDGLEQGVMKIFDQTFSLLDSNNILFYEHNTGCVLDRDNDGTDEIAITHHELDYIIILDNEGAIVETIDMDRIDSYSQIGFTDINTDGVGDIIVTIPTSGRINCFLGPDMELESKVMSYLGLDTGFCIGNVGKEGAGQFTYIIPGGTYASIYSMGLKWYEEHERWFFRGCNPQLFTYSTDPCSLYCAEMEGDGGSQEVVILSNNTLTILDIAAIDETFKELVSPHMAEQDVIFYRDHGDIEEWVSLFDSEDIDELSWESSTHRPVIFGSACSTGGYQDTNNSFAEACMRNGAGIYIGATIPSLRHLNNKANRIMKDYVEGVPIGIAFRNMEREMVDDDRDCWAQKYNLYGDPAFGTDGRPSFYQMNLLGPLEMTRSSGSLEISIDEVEFIEMEEGQRAVLEGGGLSGGIGQPLIPYVSYQIDLGPDEIASNVSISMLNNWTIFEGLSLGPGNISATDGSFQREMKPVVDPTEGWIPEMLHEWSRSQLPNGNNTINLKIYPFKYDMAGGYGKFCGEWSIEIETVIDGISIADLSGPDGSVGNGSIAEFS